MPTRKFALERGGPKQLQIRWRRGFKDFEVALDGQAWKVDRSGVEGDAPEPRQPVARVGVRVGASGSRW